MGRETRSAYWQGYVDALKAADKKISDLGAWMILSIEARHAIRDLIEDAREPR